MIRQYSVNSTSWTQITTDGESGSCWLDEQSDGAIGDVDVRIWHGKTAPGEGEKTKSKRLFKPNANNDMMIITADDEEDVYYAICASGGAECVLTVDVTGY